MLRAAVFAARLGFDMDAAVLEARLQALAEAQQEVDQLYARWAELEEKLS